MKIVLLSIAVLAAALSPAARAATEAGAADGPVSYYEDIRPLFQAKCHGCHQPAKAKGDYVMTDHVRLLAGGEEGEAIEPGKPDLSYLVEMILPVDGKAEMPKKDEPLHQEEIALIRKWIAEGAIDDTPANAVQRYDAEHPPLYTRAPVITALDYSPDGKLLAVAGFHEVLLHNADGSGVTARLIGLSERIESLAFSPDGTKLAVTGGLPGRMGEVQIWDVAKSELDLSVPVTHDTLHGASWSPDGKHIAFGCADNSVRAIDAATGKPVLYQGAHSDWVLDTDFSTDGKHLMSVGRDMAAKLIEVETERFVDNITSITPGALKGGIAALARHPSRNEILVGGSDGIPQTYRLFRETERKIGDNANLVRRFPAMEGRVWSVAWRPDGKQIAAGSSYNGVGALNIYASEYGMELPKEVAEVYSKAQRLERSEAEQKTLDEYHTQGATLLQSIPLDTALYAVTFSPDGMTVAAAGEDGQVRLVDAASGKIRKEFTPVALDDSAAALADSTTGKGGAPVNHAKGKAAEDREEALPKDRITRIDIQPSSIHLAGRNEYHQLTATAHLAGGGTADVTRLVQWSQDQPLLEIAARGLARPAADGKSTLTATLGDQSASAPVEVSGIAAEFHPNFVRDVNPVITRLGCNAGTCHGALDGKNGFKLSLRGYDPLFDVRAFADDHSARRINFASADNSLMLLKATGAVPHEGQQVTNLNSEYYRIVRDWIAAGCPLDTEVAKVASIEVFPKNPVISEIGSRQQMRVVATWTDGKKRDVSAEAFVESGNQDVAVHDDFGLLTTIRRGEAPILARYEGAYAATTVTVMGDRGEFQWTEQPAHNEIDNLVASKWQRMKILPSGLCTDEEFLRRVYLDLTGLPPSPEDIGAFLADKKPSREKRDALVDALIGSPAFVEHWANKWADKLMVNSKYLGPEGAVAYRAWIREQVAANTPYDKFVHKILTASGSNRENPPASYYKILREPVELMENTTHLFLATRFNCNKCHDHPFERWNQNQYYETAAFFSRVGLKKDPAAGDKNVGGTAVEDARPLFEITYDLDEGEMIHERTGDVAPPKFPFEATVKTAPEATRREQLAAWITAPDNQYFAMSYSNRIWGYLLGTGTIEPLDDIRAGNPPSNPELLSWLTSEFINSGFDERHLMQLICKSRTYQLSIETNEWNEDDEINFSHAKARRLPAEVLFDAVYAATGSIPNIPGVKPGTRAAELADAALDLKSGFLANLGRPPRVSACECERSNDVQLGAVMALLSGPAVADAVGDPNNAIAGLVARETDDQKMISEIFLRVLNRKPKQEEIDTALETMTQIESDHNLLVAQLAELEAKNVPVTAEKERLRLIAINKSKADIAAYTPEFQKKKAAAEKAQQERIAAAEAALKDYNDTRIAPELAKWENEIPLGRLRNTWTPIDPGKIKANGNLTLEEQDDASILASGPLTGNSDYTVTAGTALNRITGIMIEALPDERLPGFGPGLNPNGNFIVSEVALNYTPKPKPGAKGKPAAAAKALKAPFDDAYTDHIQKDFDVKNAINGNVERNDKAWAVGGSVPGTPRRATFKLAKPVLAADAADLSFTISNRYGSGEYPLGKFRIWVTDSENPLDFGIPVALASILKLAPAERSPEQQTALETYYRGYSEPGLALSNALAREKRPLPSDPEMVKLEAALAKAERPVPLDIKLEQLRADARNSIEQSANRRLTAAQDLTWALINNPAFLFNH